MFHHIDNFEVYDSVRTTGTLDPTFLNLVYTTIQNADTNFLIRQYGSNNRIGLGLRVATSGWRSVYLPLGRYLMNQNRIVIGQKLLGFSPTSASILGLSLLDGNTDRQILGFGFNTLSSGFIVYTDEQNVVRRETFSMATSLSGVEDTIEWSFIKDVNDPSEYRAFSLWVNNKPAYIGSIFRQTGSAGELAARVYGAIATRAADTTTPDGFLNSTNSVTMPPYGTTDLVVSDTRYGLVRALSRSGTIDTGPNTMASTESSGTHAEVVGAIPPSLTKYLTAIAADAEEMYGAQAFPNLSSEAVLAFGIRVLASKNNPFALDMEGTLRIGSTVASFGDIDVDLVPKFAQAYLERNPLTGLPFTPNEANTANFGAKVK